MQTEQNGCGKQPVEVEQHVEQQTKEKAAVSLGSAQGDHSFYDTVGETKQTEYNSSSSSICRCHSIKARHGSFDVLKTAKTDLLPARYSLRKRWISSSSSEAANAKEQAIHPSTVCHESAML